jgi:hypothetical protein
MLRRVASNLDFGFFEGRFAEVLGALVYSNAGEILALTVSGCRFGSSASPSASGEAFTRKRAVRSGLLRGDHLWRGQLHY